MFRGILGDRTKSSTDGHSHNVPKDTLGLHILNEPKTQDPTVDIVAVHGLDGNSYTTWTHRNGTNWLQSLLPDRIPNARIMTFGYSMSFNRARTDTSFNVAEDLLNAVQSVRARGARHRPIIFIAYSLGGIIVKKVLIIAKNRSNKYGDVFENTNYLMFFGTPHQGIANGAGTLRRFGAAFSGNASVLRELEFWSPQILQTNSAFLTEIAPALAITTYWERDKTGGVQIVDQGSARLDQGDEDVTGLYADHHGLCRFSDANDNKFTTVARRLENATSDLENAANTSIKAEQLKELLKNPRFAACTQSLNASKLRVEADRWVLMEYSRILTRELKAWIDPPTLNDDDLLRCETNLSRHESGSAQWILECPTFKSWRAKKAPVLWIAGRPGCGKSVLASRIIRHLQSTDESFVLYAFSDKHNKNKQSSASLLRTVLWQILRSERLSLSQKLDILLDYQEMSGGQSLGLESPKDDGFQLVSKLLRNYTSMFSQLILIFDGIDECQDSEYLVDMLAESTFQQEGNVSIILSSQKLANIVQRLENTALKIDMDEEEARQLTERDIRGFVMSELSNSSSSLIKTEIDTVVDLVTTKANGMFLWAAVAVPEIRAKAEIHNEDTDLFFETVQELPENMKEIFEYLLGRILRSDTSLGPKWNEKRQASLLRILQWAFNASRPLSVNELLAALNITTDVYPLPTTARGNELTWSNFNKLLSMCYPLLYVSSGIVYIMHSTFTAFVPPNKESMLSEEICAKFGGSSFQSLLAAQCLTYLSQPHFKDFVVSPTNDESSQRYPFLQYAIVNWVPHILKDPTFSTALKKQVSTFLTTSQAVTWLERWWTLRIDSFENLQSQLISHYDCVEDPEWVIRLLKISVERRIDVDPESATTRMLQVELGRMYRLQGRTEAAERTFLKLYEKHKRSLSAKDARLELIKNDLAMAYCASGKILEAKRLYEEMLGSLSESDTRSLVTVSGNLASLYIRDGQFDKAKQLYSKVLDQAIVVYGSDHQSTAMAYSNFAVACLEMADLSSAWKHSAKALELFTRLLGEDSFRTLLAMSNLAGAESGLGNRDLAADLSLHIWKRMKSLRGEAHPNTLKSGNNYAEILVHLNRFEEATNILEDLLQRSEKLPSSTPLTFTIVGNLACSLENQGRYSDSLDLEKKCLADRLLILGESHPDTLLSMHNLAQTYLRIYEICDAEPLSVKSFKTCLRKLGADHQRTCDVRDGLVSLCTLQNRSALAKHLAATNVKFLEAKYDEKYPACLHYRKQLARRVLDLGRYDEAERILRRILFVANSENVVEGNIIPATKLELSVTYRGQGMFIDAEEAALEVIEYYESTSRKTEQPDPLLITAKLYLALALQKQKRLEKALEAIQFVIDQQRRRFGPESRVLLVSQCVLASIHLDLDHSEVAERLISPVTDTWSTLLGKDNSLTGMALGIRARSCQKHKRFEEAELLQIQAMVALQVALGPSHPLTLEMKHDYAMLLYDMSDVAGAQQILWETLQGQKEVLRDGHPSIEQTVASLALVRKKTGSSALPWEHSRVETSFADSNELEQNLKQALAEASEMLGPADMETLRIKRELALFYKSCHEREKAKNMLEDVQEGYTRAQSECSIDALTNLVELFDLGGDPSQLQKSPFDQCLFVAIRESNVNLFRKLLERGAAWTVRDHTTDLSALGFAVYAGDEAMIRCLLEFNADINFHEADGNTALQQAIFGGSINVIKLLVDSGADLHGLDSERKRSPLYLACFNDRLDVVKILLDKGADPNSAEEIMPVIVAAGYNRAAIVNCLLEKQANIESLSPGGLTPLLYAVYHGHLPIVKLLIKHGANTSFKSQNGAGTLHWACLQERVDVASYLIAEGFDTNEPMEQSGFRPLNIAAEVGNLGIFEALIAGGAMLDLEAQNDAAMTPLASAARFGKVNIVQRILDKNRRTLNKQCGQNRVSPLHFAVAFGQIEAVVSLIEAGADLNVANSTGATPLIEAVLRSNVEILEKLKTAGANLQLAANNGLTGLEFAFAQKDIKLIEALISGPQQIDLNAFIFSRVTPLGLAIYMHYDSAVQKMLDRGADPNIRDPYSGATTLHYAVQRRRQEAIDMILACGRADQSLQDIFGRTPLDWLSPSIDPSSTTLDSRHRTTPLVQASKTRTALSNSASSIRKLLANGAIENPTSVTELLEVIATGLLVLGIVFDAVAALEHCITRTNTPEGGHALEHTVTCDACGGFGSITGPARICAACPMTALCEECFARHKSGEKKCEMCMHGGEDFVAVPSAEWSAAREKDDEEDEVKGFEGGRRKRLEKWLDEVGGRYGWLAGEEGTNDGRIF